MGAEDWYFATRGQQQGPVTLETLQNLVRSGELLPDELVWTQSMPDWAPAKTIQGLFPSPGSTLILPADGVSGPNVISYYTPTERFVYAGFWLRFCAILIDSILLGIPVAATIFVIEMNAPRVNYFRNRPPLIMELAPVILNLMSIVGGWLYFALLESSSYQATLGKRLVGIQVVGSNGERITFGRATGRFFGKIVSYMIFYVGFIMAAFTAKKQALHDMIASTLVIKKTP